MPGGVNSPVRAFAAVGGAAPFVASASGARVTTVDGEQLVDFISSWGALILGHADPAIVEAVAAASRNGTSFGLSTVQEVELAELICDMVPSVDMVRLVNSGTEAAASAIRIARAATGKPGIVKFDGCYHGHADAFLVKAGSGAATFGTPDSPGVPRTAVSDTRVARFNDLGSVEDAFTGDDIAAVIVEPVAGNMGVVPPAVDFLPGLRRLCDQHGALLVFDEVMTGFRVSPGGAQELFGVTPDLTCLGKVMGGGTPAAAYGGREDLMRQVAPEGPVYQAGTLAGNPLVVAAGLACLRRLRDDPGIYDRLETLGAGLEARLVDALADDGCVQRIGSMMTVFFGPRRVRSFADSVAGDGARFARFFHECVRRGVLLPPSRFEAWFLTLAHEAVVDEAGDALAAAIEASR